MQRHSCSFYLKSAQTLLQSSAYLLLCDQQALIHDALSSLQFVVQFLVGYFYCKVTSTFGNLQKDENDWWLREEVFCVMQFKLTSTKTERRVLFHTTNNLLFGRSFSSNNHQGGQLAKTRSLVDLMRDGKQKSNDRRVGLPAHIRWNPQTGKNWHGRYSRIAEISMLDKQRGGIECRSKIKQGETANIYEKDPRCSLDCKCRQRCRVDSSGDCHKDIAHWRGVTACILP